MQQAVLVAERIRQTFSQLTLLEPGLLSVSIGVVTTRESGYDLVRLLSQADEVLYVAKGMGRNRVQAVALRETGGGDSSIEQDDEPNNSHNRLIS
ncbi:response regulator PleD [compost metagenome]